jgi:hypothetical protein
VRAADLQSFRSALAALVTDGSPLDARDRLVIVPTRAAAAHLVRSIEDRMWEYRRGRSSGFLTRGELYERLSIG